MDKAREKGHSMYARVNPAKWFRDAHWRDSRRPDTVSVQRPATQTLSLLASLVPKKSFLPSALVSVSRVMFSASP